MPILKKFFAKLHVPENLDVDLGDCREETRLSLGLRDVMGTVYDQLGWSSLLGARRKSANSIVRELVMAPPVAAGEQACDGRDAGQSGGHHAQSGFGIQEHGLS